MYNDCHEPDRRWKPTYMGDVDTTQMGGIYDVQDMRCKPDPNCGYKLPQLEPLPVTFPAMTQAEQMRDLSSKVNELCFTIDGYNKKVEEAYKDIVNSCVCNDAYYSDMWTENGYIPESGANYKVVHIPFLDRSHQPIYFELALAYDNTTNAGLKEECFAASQRLIADKLIPAQNKGDSFTGCMVWKGAPIFTEEGDSYTFAVTQNGFFKGYKNASAEVLQQDKIRNACGARGILVYNKALATDSFPSDGSTMKARVAVGQNYETKERFIIVVDGGESVGCTSEQLANLFVKYGCMVALELASGTSTYGMDKGAMMFPPAVSSEDDVPSVPESNAFWYITKRRHYHNEYVKDVALLAQKMGEEVWRRVILNEQTDYVKQRIVSLAKELKAEIEDRKAADNELLNHIDSEVTRLEETCERIETESKNRDTALDEKIATKEKESKERDTALDEKIATKEKESKERDEALEQEILTKERESKERDSALGLQDVKKVAHVDDGDKRTYSLYRNDDTKIPENIEVYEYNKLVAQFVTMAQLADNLKTETSERKKADADLQTQITQEVSDRNQDTVALTASITKESNERKAADETLTNSLNNEIRIRESNIAELNTRLDNYSGTTDEVIKQLTDDLSQEIKDRGEADNAINALIMAEQTARENGDTELSVSLNALIKDYETFKTDTTADLTAKKSQIDALVVDVTNIKAILDTHTTQMSSINATITALQTTISTMEASLENMKQSISNMQTTWEQYKITVDASLAELKEDIEALAAECESKYVLKAGDAMTGKLRIASFIDGNSKIEIIDKESHNPIIFVSEEQGARIIAEHSTSEPSSFRSFSINTDGTSASIIAHNYDELDFIHSTLSISENLPIKIGAPTKDAHAATKKYVDTNSVAVSAEMSDDELAEIKAIFE